MKTLDFEWQFGDDKVGICVNSYASNGCLYVGLMSVEDVNYVGDQADISPWGDVTVNLPCSNKHELKVNEAYVNSDFSDDILRFIQKYELGTVLPDVGFSGYGVYAKVAFNMDRLREFDPAGVERHMNSYDRDSNLNQNARSTDDTQTERNRSR